LQQLLVNRLQWAALSATIGDSSNVRDFLMGNQEDCIFLNYPTERPIDAQIRQITSEHTLLDMIQRLTQAGPAKLLIFANSRGECERLAGMLQQSESLKQNIFAHYSSLSSEVRLDIERKFADTNTAICIATSTLELGIDIGDIDAVILWGVPGNIESFLQRVGRGNRRSNKTNVIGLISDDCSNPLLETLRFMSMVDLARHGTLPIRQPYDLFGAISQQMLSVIASEGGGFTRVADLYELVNHKNYINREILENILAELASKNFLQHHGFKNRYGEEEALYRLVDMKLIYGNFGVGSQNVDIYHGSKRLGEIPAVNLMRMSSGIEVRFAGKCWRVQKFSREGIHLRPCKITTGAINFSYGGKGIQPDTAASDSVWNLIHSTDLRTELLTKELRQQITGFIEKVKEHCCYEEIPYIRSDSGIRYFTFAGYLINKAIGLASEKIGFKADDISITVSSPIEWSEIPQNPGEYEKNFPFIFEESSDQSIYQQSLPLDLQQKEYLQEWLKDKTIPKVLARLVNGKPKLIEKSVLPMFVD
jgi:ATP-dependent Lhr-like helicase